MAPAAGLIVICGVCMLTMVAVKCRKNCFYEEQRTNFRPITISANAIGSDATAMTAAK